MTTDSTRRTPNAPLREDPARAASSLGAGGSDIPAAASLQAWLVEHRNRGTTPDRVAAELVANGWDADAAARVAMRSAAIGGPGDPELRCAHPRRRARRARRGRRDAPRARREPGPVAAHLDAVDRGRGGADHRRCGLVGPRGPGAFSRFVMWSPSRRGWFGALALCTGAVGLVRLLGYVFAAIATLTGASDRPFTAVAAAQVAVSLAVAVPLFVWSLREWRRSNLVISALERHDREAAPPTT